MPGKYSHGVVLAQYSSLGLIDLPNSQHVAYLDSCPPSTHGAPSSTSRAQSHTTPKSRAQSVKSDARQRPPVGLSSSAGWSATAINDRSNGKRRLILDGDPEPETVGVTTQAGDSSQRGLTSNTRTPPSPHARAINNVVHKEGTSRTHTVDQTNATPRAPLGSSRRLYHAESGSSSHDGPSVRSSEGEPANSSVGVANSVSSNEDRDPALEYHDYIKKVASRTHLVRQFRTPPPSLVPNQRRASPVDSAIAQSTPPSKVPQHTMLNSSTSACATETRIFNPLPEDADFHGFSDTDGEEGFKGAAKIDQAYTSNGRSSFETKSDMQTVVPLQQVDQTLQGRQVPSDHDYDVKVSDLCLTPLHSRQEPRYNSLDSLSSLGSFSLPIVEHSHPLKVQQQRAGNQLTKSPARSSQLSTSEESHGESFSPSLFELKPSPRDSSGTRHLKLVRKDPALRQLVDNEDEGEWSSHSVSSASAVIPPDILMYRARNGVSSPLAQVQMMLQKREEEEELKKYGTVADAGPRREDRVRDAERRLMQLKAAGTSGDVPTLSKPTKLKKKSSAFFWKTFRG